MKFPYAAKGVSKIFTAEIMSIISAVVLGIASILGILAVAIDKETPDATAAGVLALIAGVLVCLAAVFILVAVVLNVVGYLQAAKDEEGFRRAVLCTIFSFFFLFGCYLFEGIAQTSGDVFLGWVSTILNVISQVLSMLVTIYMIGGIMNMAAECNRPDMVIRGGTILKLLIVLYIVSYIVTFIVRYFRENAFNQTVVMILSGFAAILSAFLYFYQLYFLGKARKMLKES